VNTRNIGVMNYYSLGRTSKTRLSEFWLCSVIVATAFLGSRARTEQSPPGHCATILPRMGHIDPTAWVAPTAVVTGAVVPIGWIAAARPAQLLSPDRHDELRAAQEPLDFPGTVYGVSRGTSMRAIMRRQCEAYGPARD